MNAVLTYLEKNWQRLSLDRFGSSSRLSAVMWTPRFQASGHLIVFVLNATRVNPLLVVKLPRISGDHRRLDREVANLREIQAAREGGFDSIPEVIAYEDYANHRLLVETVVPGKIMQRSMVRSQTEDCLQAGLNWLIDLQSSTVAGNNHNNHGVEALTEYPLNLLENSYPLSAEEQQLVKRTRKLIEPIHCGEIPLVFEHGDFSAPNILIDQHGRLGVVDWELAEPFGLPTADLFFFLSYVAFSKQRARRPSQYLRAFHHAFFQPKGWTRPYILRYCKALDLPPELLKPLFVLTWSRYVANIIKRLTSDHISNTALADHTVAWLRSNRYYMIWRHSVEHIDDFKG